MTGPRGTQLPDDEAHLWLGDVDDPGVRDRGAAYLELLSEDERARYERIRVEHGRREYLLGRALARACLSRYAAIEPAAWELTPDERGRPEITGPAGAPRLRFNLAHSRGLVGCLITAATDCGLDVESPDRRVEIDLLAERYFSPTERQQVLAAAERREAFFGFWTLKEAYLKAQGIGISVPLSSLSFRLERSRRIEVAFEDPLEDRPDDWRFDLYRAPSGHFLATAFRRPRTEPLTLVAKRVTPLARGSRAARLTHLASSEG